MRESDSDRLLLKKVQELQALLDFGRAITGLASPEDIVRRLALTIAGQWALRTYGIAVRREGRDPLVRQRGLPLLADGQLRLAGPTGALATIGTEPRLLPGGASPEAGVLATLGAAGVRAVVPLVSGETPCGLVALGERPGGIPWQEEDLVYASGLATQALIALEAAWQREEALQWRLLGEAREEWRRLDSHSSLVFAAVARLGPRELPPEATLLDALADLLSEAGLALEKAQLTVALERLVSRGALERVAGGSLELRKPDWLLLPEVRGPLAELVRAARRHVGGYELLEKIGAGGMAEVFRARSLSDQSEAAIKLISEDRTDEPYMRERFEREGEIVSRLSHPNIVRLLARGEHEGRLYLAMELLPGESVYHACRRQPFPLGEALRALREIGSALAALHGSGVLHRDVKASNIMRLPGGEFVLLDFGLARGLDSRSVTRSGEIVGTAAYLAPEVISGRQATAACDIWALGIVFLEMLAGRWPWNTAAGLPLAIAILRSRPEIPEALAAVAGGAVYRLVEGMLADEPHRRIVDGEALVEALSSLPEAELPSFTTQVREPFDALEATATLQTLIERPARDREPT